jgi:hypothetical protein
MSKTVLSITSLGTPTKRQVFKRQVSIRPVSKRLKRQVYKTSGLQNIRFTKRQVFKMSGCKMSGFKTSLLVNISKRPFSKKYIDLTYEHSILVFRVNPQVLCCSNGCVVETEAK